MTASSFCICPTSTAAAERVIVQTNTLETFKWCWGNGSAVECDCKRTKDDVGFMLHDGTLNRTAHGLLVSIH